MTKETKKEISPLERMVPPHTKVSRTVISSDVERVVEESKILHAICFEPSGMYGGALAMHHSQIDDKDPLNFFVTFDRKIVINPIVTRHSNYMVDSKEGCRSFPDKPEINVDRWRILEVDYLTIMVDPDNEKKFKLSSIQHEELRGREAFIYQHEIQHSKGEFIYPLTEK